MPSSQVVSFTCTCVTCLGMLVTRRGRRSRSDASSHLRYTYVAMDQSTQYLDANYCEVGKWGRVASLQDRLRYIHPFRLALFLDILTE